MNMNTYDTGATHTWEDDSGRLMCWRGTYPAIFVECYKAHAIPGGRLMRLVDQVWSSVTRRLWR